MINPFFRLSSIARYKTIYLILTMLLLPLFLAGCSIPKAYIYSERDPAFAISKDQTFHIVYDIDEPITQRKHHAAIQQAFLAGGFTLDDQPVVNYLVIYDVQSSTQKIDTYRPYTTTDHITTDINNKTHIGTRSRTEYLPYSYSETSKTLTLTVLRHDPEKKLLASVWKGSITAEKDIFDKYSQEAILEMMKHFPDDYSGEKILKKLPAGTLPAAPPVPDPQQEKALWGPILSPGKS